MRHIEINSQRNETLRLPQDISNLLAVCIKNLIWYKDNIYSFFRECEVPNSILVQVKKRREEPTLKLVPFVLEELYKKGDEGFLIAKKMLTKIYYWKDIHSIPPERKDDAINSLKELQKAYKTHMAQEQYLKEKEAQTERERRLEISKIDHRKLEEFRDRFDQIYFMEPHKRGDAYEILMNDIFKYYFPKAFEGFNRTGEQIDGQFYFDGHWYFIEVRWREQPASAADISVLRDRASKGFAGDVRAVFISYNGFSPDCLESLDASAERVILLTGYDLRSVLECEIALDVLLHDIQAYLVKYKKAYISAIEIIRLKSGN
jgi:hypothetical protein